MKATLTFLAPLLLTSFAAPHADDVKLYLCFPTT